MYCFAIYAPTLSGPVHSCGTCEPVDCNFLSRWLHINQWCGNQIVRAALNYNYIYYSGRNVATTSPLRGSIGRLPQTWVAGSCTEAIFWCTVSTYSTALHSNATLSSEFTQWFEVWAIGTSKNGLGSEGGPLPYTPYRKNHSPGQLSLYVR